jgi:hypothetical protein
VAFRVISSDAETKSLNFSNNIAKVSNHLNIIPNSRGSFQLGTHYSDVTGKFTAPYDGLYYFHGTITWRTDNFSASYLGAIISKSSLKTFADALLITYDGGNQSFFNPNFSQIVQGVLKLDTADAIALYGYSSYGSGNVDISLCCFGGYLIYRI